MTTGNRTNHFTDEQVIAAAMVIDRNAFRVGEAESNAWETGRDFPSELSAAKQRIRTRKYRAKKKARAALVAAAGAAPQADSEIYYCPIHGDLLDPMQSRSQRCFNAPDGHEYAALAAPAHPSCTVDEAALIREAKAEAWDEAVEMVHEEEHAFVDKMWGTVVPKLTIIEALRARAAEYREGSGT